MQPLIIAIKHAALDGINLRYMLLTGRTFLNLTCRQEAKVREELVPSNQAYPIHAPSI